MKARVFPKLDMPNDLYEIDKFIGHYDYVEEQIEFLKYVELEMELYYETKFEDEFDATDRKTYDYWIRILDKKIKFYEDILANEKKENSEQVKNNLSVSEVNEVNINDPKEFDKMLDTYLEYGKECYLATWKDDSQLLTFEKKLIDRYGIKVKGYIVHLYKYIAKITNPIEFIGCDYDQQRINFDKEKLKYEINRIDGYITEIEKLAYLTEDDINTNNIPEDELEEFEEWECYYIEKIKDKELVEWINCLRINRPGVWDYKYGEYYQVDFKIVTEFALKEFKNYKDRLENLQITTEVKTKIKNVDKTENQLKSFGRGELQEALEPIAKEFELIIGESAPSKIVRLITKKLRGQGWDANEPSVSEALRKMSYVKGRRK